MGRCKDGNRRSLLMRLLHLWNLVPDDTFAQVIIDLFGLKDKSFEHLSDEEVYSMISDAVTGRTTMIYRTRLHKAPPERADNIYAWRDFTSDDYTRAHTFLDELKQHTDSLTTVQYAAIKKQALDGDVEGARRALVSAVTQSENGKEARQRSGGAR